ncbi:MAG: SdrD B-like domain-containing protein [Chloroflexota bacterium]
MKIQRRIQKFFLLSVSLILIFTTLTGCDTFFGIPEKGDGGKIGDYVWQDDGDGIQEADESPLAEVQVNLYEYQSNTPLATVFSNNQGKYTFTNIESGRYILEFLPPEGYNATLQDQGDDDTLDSDVDPITYYTDVFELVPGEQRLNLDAGFMPSATITPEKTPAGPPTQTPTYTPTLTPTITNTPPLCGCETPNVTFTVTYYDNSPGWSDCGQASACNSILHGQQVPSGSEISDPDGHCKMNITCP